MSAQQICISGIGLVTPLGQRVADNWAALKNDQRAASTEIKGFKALDYIKRRYLRPLDDVTIRCIAMTGAAMQDAGVKIEDFDPARVGIVVGSMFAGIGCIFNFKQTCYEGRQENYVGLSPLYFPGIVFNALSGQPAIEYGYTGPNAVVNAGFVSGLLAVIKGIEYIQTGKADVVIAGGAEMSHSFIRQKYVVQKNDPAIESLGTDFQPAEAVCLFVLHRGNDQRFSRDTVYAMVEGWRYGFQPNGFTSDGLAREIMSIPALAGNDLGAVVMSSYEGSSLSQYEGKAIQKLFATRNPVLLRNKKNFGHTLGASASLDLFHGLLFARNQEKYAGTVLVNALDPGGNYAFLSIRTETHYD